MTADQMVRPAIGSVLYLLLVGLLSLGTNALVRNGCGHSAGCSRASRP